MNKLAQTIMEKQTDDLVEKTLKRDKYEIEYELEKARMIMSAEVQAFSNQTMRDAQVTLLMEQNGMYRNMAELRADARGAWYRWSALKSLIDGKLTYDSHDM